MFRYLLFLLVLTHGILFPYIVGVFVWLTALKQLFVCTCGGTSWWPENYFKLKPWHISFWSLRCCKIGTVNPQESLSMVYPLSRTILFVFSFLSFLLLCLAPRYFSQKTTGVEILMVDPFCDAVALWDLSLMHKREMVYQTHNTEWAPCFNSCFPRPTRPSKTQLRFFQIGKCLQR